MAVTYGVSRSTNSRIRKVGIGSSEHDLTGDDIIIRQTSSVVGRKDDHEDVAVSTMTGAGESAVSALMLSTLRVKYSANPSAVCSVAPVTSRFLPSITDSVLAGERPASDTRSVQ